MKQRKKTLIIAAVAAAVVLLVLGILFVPKLFRSPAEEFLAYQQEVFVKPLLAFWEDGLNTYSDSAISTDMTITFDVDDSALSRYLENTSLTLKMEAEQDELLLNGDMTLMGSPALSGTVTYREGMLGFCLPEIDENYYVMDLAALSDGQFEPDAQKPEITAKEWIALFRSYLDLVSTVVTEENVVLEKRADFRLEELGSSYTGKVYTFTPTAADVEAAMNKLADRLEQDEDLRSLLLKLTSASPVFTGEDSQTALSKELDEELEDMVAQLRDGAAEAGQAVEDSGFTWKLYVEGKRVRMIRWETTGDGNAIVCEFEGSDGNGALVLYANSSSVGKFLCRYDYSKQGSVCRGKLSLTSDGESFSVDYDVDTGKCSALNAPYGSYTVVLPNDGLQLSVNVADSASGGADHVFTLQGDADYFGGAYSQFIVTVHTTDQGSAKPPEQEAVDITGYSDEELEALGNDLINGLYMHLLFQIMPLLYSF